MPTAPTHGVLDDSRHAPRPTHRWTRPWFQVRRALAEPDRLRRLHYSSLLASAHALIEPPPLAVAAELLGVSPATVTRLERDLVSDHTFLRAIEQRHAAVRGIPLRLLGPTAAEDHDHATRLLYCVTRLLEPDVIVETGVFDGVSSAVMLKALDDAGRGHLHSIDLPAHTPQPGSTDRMPWTTLPPGHDPGWLVPDALRGRWTLRLGSSRDLLPDLLAAVAPIDLFLHDSLHTASHMTFELEAAWQALRPGGVLLSDDVWWNSAFHRFARRVGRPARVTQGLGVLRTSERPA